MRAIELFDKKDDEISQAMARMLIKELDMRVEDMQPCATPAQNKVQPASQRQRQVLTTAANTT
jgi:FtsZ-binding cell division protein ZapB